MHSRLEWIQVGSYTIWVDQIGEGYLPRPGNAPAAQQGEATDDFPEMQRVAYVNVIYRNDTPDTTLNCRRNQWHLYDTEGYAYEVESDRIYYTNHSPLHGGQFVNPGGKARGWLAFKVPASAQLERIQFFTGFLATQAVDIRLYSE